MSRSTISDNGLLTHSFIDSDIKIVTTYDGKLWGNMNPYYTTLDEEKDQIKKNDHRLSDILGTKTAFVLTTPPEDTIINLSRESFYSLDLRNKEDEGGYKYIPIRANAIIAERIESNPYEIIFAPADCAILTMKPRGVDIVIAIHIGSPQMLQGIHIKSLNTAKSLYPNINWNNLEVYVTPYICKNHYTISEDTYKLFRNHFRNQDLLTQYTEETVNPNFEGKRYRIDFINIVKTELREHFGISEVVESGFCTYEESLKGNLFSHELSQENENDNKYKGAFNVAIKV
ncbi:MAG TPA: laccase domain-containing protein [Candidatus Dojkabacteria bacterium]|nr:laccase domain-containing protein [Candidatus Dojkabacteria bacterium]